MKKIILSILLGIMSLWSHAALSDSARVYLISCTPGNQAWSHYGHTAIWVNDPTYGIDLVFNYGIFDFNTDNFYYKFCTGDTWYQLGIESLETFIRSYALIGRKTYWQQLNFSPQQRQALFDSLLVNYEPQNRFYHYNFVFDNCATRPYYLIQKVVGDSIRSPYVGYLHTPYRQAISHYTGRHGWMDFAINMVFGSRADQPMESLQRLFLPEELMFYMSKASLPDGTPLVAMEHIAPFEVAPVPWWQDCRFGIALFVILMLLITCWNRRIKHFTWGVDVVFALIWLLLIAISIFLTYFSCHPLVGFNWRLILFPVLHACTRALYWVR